MTGRRSLVFDKRKAHSGVAMKVPCGQCIGCKLERSRQWAMRCMQEKRMFVDSAFLTLTYDEKHLPSGGTLVKRDLQLFMKRLRFSRPSLLQAGLKYQDRPVGLRFYACGEYGETSRRPHYHVLLFNTCFPDMKLWKQAGENPLYASAELNGLWTAGNALIGEVTFESCAYVARYCTKVITGEKAEQHYSGREREFTVMSRRPGIGYFYFQKFGDEAYAHDSAVVSGREQGLPRYYDTKFEVEHGPRLEELKKERRRRAKLKKADQTSARRRAIEAFEYAKAATFKRNRA